MLRIEIFKERIPLVRIVSILRLLEKARQTYTQDLANLVQAFLGRHIIRMRPTWIRTKDQGIMSRLESANPVYEAVGC